MIENKDKDIAYNEFISLAMDLIGGDYNDARRYADKLWNMASCFTDADTVSTLQSIADGFERLADGYYQNMQNAVAEFDSICKGRKTVKVEKIKYICKCYLDV